MAQKKQVYKEKLKQTGYWKYKDIYDELFHWLKDHNYKIFEELYNEKLLSNGKEVIIKWRAERKITDYFKFQQMLEWHILGMKDAEIEVDGKKVSTQKGEVEIIFKANLIKDYEKRWEDKPFWKFLRSVYEKYVVRETVDEYEDDVEDEAKEMISEFKAFLNIPGR
jgi:cytochrome P450